MFCITLRRKAYGKLYIDILWKISFVKSAFKTLHIVIFFKELFTIATALILQKLNPIHNVNQYHWQMKLVFSTIFHFIFLCISYLNLNRIGTKEKLQLKLWVYIFRHAVRKRGSVASINLPLKTIFSITFTKRFGKNVSLPNGTCKVIRSSKQKIWLHGCPLASSESNILTFLCATSASMSLNWNLPPEAQPLSACSFAMNISACISSIQCQRSVQHLMLHLIPLRAIWESVFTLITTRRNHVNSKSNRATFCTSHCDAKSELGIRRRNISFLWKLSR